MFNVDPNLIVECTGGCNVLRSVVLSALLFFILLTGFAYTTVLERRLLAWFQDRIGPNRAGPLGLLQPVADGLKLIFKEDMIPSGADKFVYILAPIIKTIPAIIVVAVIPLGPPLIIPWFDGLWYRVPLALIEINVGVLYLLAMLSLGTYGIALAGWASNNKYSMLGSLRASAQMVSYELSLGLTMAVPVLITGSMNVSTIIAQQGAPLVLGWFVFQNPVAALVLCIALLAETNRAPFDLPEAESELTAGYHTEYSGMKFALFFMAEYIAMISVCMIAIALFFGGYHFIFVDQVPILGPLVYIGKVIGLLSLMIWVRATLPRIRYDRLMDFGWKVLIPLALVAVAWTAVALVIGDATNSTVAYLVASGIFFAIVLVALSVLYRPKTEGEQRGDMAGSVVSLQNRNVGWIALNAVGGLLSIPIIIVGALGKGLRSAARSFSSK